MIGKLTGKKSIHEAKIKSLERKKTIAEMKRKELELKIEILKLKIPFRPRFQFSKFIVLFCIAAIISYTVAAIFMQKYIGYELSPTLTTSVFAFFGTELLGLAGIKIFDTKFSSTSASGYDYAAGDCYTANNCYSK